MKIKSLEWTGYKAETPFGNYRFQMFDDGVCPELFFEKKSLGLFDTMEEGMSAAEAHWQAKIGEVLV